jgi:hypothetical protein
LTSRTLCYEAGLGAKFADGGKPWSMLRSPQHVIRWTNVWMMERRIPWSYVGVGWCAARFAL